MAGYRVLKTIDGTEVYQGVVHSHESEGKALDEAVRLHGGALSPAQAAKAIRLELLGAADAKGKPVKPGDTVQLELKVTDIEVDHQGRTVLSLERGTDHFGKLEAKLVTKK